MTGLERQVTINTTNIAMMLKFFWIIMGGIAVNIIATFLGINRNGKKNNGGN